MLRLGVFVSAVVLVQPQACSSDSYRSPNLGTCVPAKDAGDYCNVVQACVRMHSCHDNACVLDCDPANVNLADYPQWEHEDGYWLGELTYLDGNGDPTYIPDSWNYPYNHYKGFIAGSVHGPSYSQRNVFLYPPQTTARCALDANTAFEGDLCGINGGIKKFQADQTTMECDPLRPGAISGKYDGKNSSTQLIGAGDALLYQVFNDVNGVDTLEHSQLTTITTLPDGSMHRTRTAQLFDRDAMTEGRSGAPYHVSFYRERKVSEEVFFAALKATIASYNVSDTAVGKICYGGVEELQRFLEGGRTWPVEEKFVCAGAPVTFRPLRWAAAGAGQYPATFGRETVGGEMVTDDDITAAAGVGAGLTADMLIGYGWWEDATLVWASAGAGQYPDTFGRETVAGELVSDADLVAAAGVGAGLTPEALVGYTWWELKILTWAAAGTGQYPSVFGRETVEGEAVTPADITSAAGVGAGLSTEALMGYGWWELRA